MATVDLEKYRRADGSVDWKALQSDQEWDSSFAGPNAESGGTAMWSRWGQKGGQQAMGTTSPLAGSPSSMEDRYPWMNDYLKEKGQSENRLTNAQASQSSMSGGASVMSGIAQIGNAVNDTMGFWKSVVDDYLKRKNPDEETRLTREAVRGQIRGQDISNASMMQEYLRNKRRDEWYRNLGTYLRRG